MGRATSAKYQTLTAITLFMLFMLIVPNSFAQQPKSPKNQSPNVVSPKNQSPNVISPKNQGPEALDPRNQDPTALNTTNQDPTEVDAQEATQIRKGALAAKQPPKSKLIVKQTTNGNFVLTSVPADSAAAAREENLAKEPAPTRTPATTAANGLTREQRLTRRLEIAQQQRAQLQSELNDLQTRSLQNRPDNPNKAGDPYYVDPAMRKQVDTVKQQLADTQKQIDELVDELEGGR